jgi:hypothetical protein
MEPTRKPVKTPVATGSAELARIRSANNSDCQRFTFGSSRITVRISLIMPGHACRYVQRIDRPTVEWLYPAYSLHKKYLEIDHIIKLNFVKTII